MSDDNAEEEIIEEVHEIEETEIIVPDEPDVAIYEEDSENGAHNNEESSEPQNEVPTTITTIAGKPVTTFDVSKLQTSTKDGKSVQFKILNVNGTLKLVPCFVTPQIVTPATATVDTNAYPVTFINQQLQAGHQIQIKNGSITDLAPITSPSNQTCDVEPSEYRLWSTNATKLLIELYKKYQGKVGSGEIKSWKKCWEIIANDINKLVPEVNISGCHAENRWRVLVRNYKKYLTKSNYKKFFEYAKEFNEINSMKERPYIPYKKRDEIKNEPSPLLMFSQPTGTVLTPGKLIPIRPRIEPVLTKAPQASAPAVRNVVKTPNLKRDPHLVNRKKFSKVNIFSSMRRDRLRYYRERIAIEKVKLQLEREKITQIKLKNRLMKERNEILANFNINSVLYDICAQ